MFIPHKSPSYLTDLGIPTTKIRIIANLLDYYRISKILCLYSQIQSKQQIVSNS